MSVMRMPAPFRGDGVVIGSAPAWAQGVPAPLAGEVGIVGLAAGGAVYVGYRLYTYFRGNR